MGPLSRVIQVDPKASDKRFEELKRGFNLLCKDEYFLLDFDCYYDMFMIDAENFLKHGIPTKSQREEVDEMKDKAKKKKDAQKKNK